MLDHMTTSGFVAPQQRAMIAAHEDAERLLAGLDAYHAPSTALHLTPAES
jgi:hypothetical protein